MIWQSRALLHIYLPFPDRGFDACIHRLTDGSYIPVQVKVRTKLIAGMVRLTVRASSLLDDDALLIATLIDDGALGPSTLVVDEATFKGKARKGRSEGEPVYYAEFSMHPRKGTPWHDHVVPTSGLAERLLAQPTPPHRVGRWPEGPEGASSWLPIVPPTLQRPRSLAGASGEIEVLRQLIRDSAVDLFRPFPDLETVEILMRHEKSRRIGGVQVKTVEVGERHPHGTALISRPSFRPSPTTWLVVLAWRRAAGAFHSECLLVPTLAVPDVAYVEKKNFELYFRPGSTKASALDEYRVPLASLATQLIALIA